MQNDKEYVWYASYGSNISKDRFSCYIRGGTPPASQKEHVGCNDKSLPIADEKFYIPHELYFAKASPTWNNGGVGFIKATFDENVVTYARIYLITKHQFIDIVRQENNNFEGELRVDFENAVKDGNFIFRENAWYGNLIYLGSEGGSPIFTFTNSNNLDSEINQPDENYLKTISTGLQESHKLKQEEINDYFKSKKGIQGYEIENELEKLLK